MKTIDEKDKIVTSAFTMFLKANNAYTAYRKALAEARRGLDFHFMYSPLYEKEQNIQYKWNGFIFNAFTWCETKEGKSDPLYWPNLHQRWHKILKQIKDNDYEISEDISCTILSRSD